MAKLNIGDYVRFLNSVGGGRVVRIDDKTIYVEDEDGFEIPSSEKELVHIEDAPQKTQSPKQNESVQRTEISRPAPTVIGEIDEIVADSNYDFTDDIADDKNPHFLLAFLNENNGNSGMVNLYAINDSNYFVFFTLTEVAGESDVNMLHYGTIEPNTKLLLGRYNPQRIDEKQWQTQLILFKRGKRFGAYPPISTAIKIKSNRFYRDNGFVDNDFFEEKAIMFPIIKGELEKKLEELSFAEMQKIALSKEHAEKPKTNKRQKTNEIVEIDLHINELLENTAGLSNGEMLQVQLDTFHTTMEQYASCHGQRIVFIHGVGNGTLKTELRKSLERKYKNVKFQDASFKEYGYGATMVVI